MDNRNMNSAFCELSTPLISDACMRLGVEVRLAPHGIRPVTAKNHVAGRVLPVQHYGSVDIFLEAMSNAEPGDILVIDNSGRKDEGCIGDLTVLEAKASGLEGIIVFGSHRDTDELISISFPVFSYGTWPMGPCRLDGRDVDALEAAHFGDFIVSGKDVVFADTDGVVFVPEAHADEVLTTAMAIRQIERKQAEEIRSGNKLRDQLRFDEYMVRHSSDPEYTFRKHLRRINGAIEE